MIVILKGKPVETGSVVKLLEQKPGAHLWTLNDDLEKPENKCLQKYPGLHFDIHSDLSDRRSLYKNYGRQIIVAKKQNYWETEYPRGEIDICFKDFPFTCTPCYMLALIAYLYHGKVKEIHMPGMLFLTDKERLEQKYGIDGWLYYLRAKGVSIYLPLMTSLQKYERYS